MVQSGNQSVCLCVGLDCPGKLQGGSNTNQRGGNSSIKNIKNQAKAVPCQVKLRLS